MMSEKEKPSCVDPAQGPILPEGEETTSIKIDHKKEKTKMKPLVGNPAPDFEANAY